MYSFCLFTFLSVFLVFHGKNLVVLNIINIYVISTSAKFLKSKDTVQNKFLISVNYSINVMQIAAVAYNR